MQQVGNRKTLISFLWSQLRPEWLLLVVAQLGALGWSMDSSLWPYVMQFVIDALIAVGDNRSEMWSVLALPITAGISLVLWTDMSMRVSHLIMARLQPRIQASIRLKMCDDVLRHSYRYFGDHPAGALARKIDNMAKSTSNLLRDLIYLFVPSAVAIALSGLLFSRTQPGFAFLLALWFSIQVAISIAFAKKCNKKARDAAEAGTTLTGALVDLLANHVNVRLFSSPRFEHHYLGALQREEQERQERSYMTVELMRLAMVINYFLVGVIAINGYLFYSWQQGVVTTGEFVFIFYSMWNLTMMVWVAGNQLPELYHHIGICRQAFSAIQEPPEVCDVPSAPALHISRGEIVFHKVTFQYGHNQLFRDKTLTIHSKEKIGLVGFSGAGKSSFVHLILRFFDPQEGKILIDGQEIDSVSQESLRSQISFIPQDPQLFHRSLLENIRYGRLTASDEEVFEASRRAQCDDFIQKLPARYETLVGERGIKLSGGQRQRIAIARALLKNAPILILDEATSMLDSVTEHYIQDNLQELLQNRTVIVIAHRLSTLVGMDRILVFNEGKIVEEGNHTELLALNGHYAYMWAMQSGGFLPNGPASD